MQQWEYLTVYLSDDLDFPSAVDRGEVLSWASKSITQRLNAHAALGWEIFDLHWLSETELMVTFKRPVPPESDRDAP
jgi:hypothetical protein